MTPQRVGMAAEAVCAAAICLFVLYTAAFGRFASDFQNGVMLTLSLVAVLAGRGWGAEGWRQWADAAWRLVLIAGAVGAGLYYIANFQQIAAMRAGLPNTADLIAYAVGALVVIEAARRAEGLLFQGVVIVALLYLLLGHLPPGILRHRPMGHEEVLELVFSPQGVFGVAFTSVVNVVWIFVILGVALRVTGAGDFFTFIADRLTRGLRSGPAQCAVVASALFGSINGSAPANVASTGVLTIPMMKRAGYPAPFAAATEASASCVGQLLPPVMGVGAFIMSEITGIPYLQIMAAAIAPALLFVVAISISVALEARRLGLRASAAGPREPWTPTRRAQGLVLLATFATLLVMLFSGYSAPYAGFGAVVTTMAVATLLPSVRPGLAAWRSLIVDGGRDGLALAVACAAIGVVIAGVTATGLGVKLNQTIAGLGGTSLLAALLLAALCSLVIGMGLPTAAAYLTVVFIAGPAIISLGVDVLQAHLFVFYYAVLSAITPPVALALFAACAIAKAPLAASAASVLRISFVGFLLPVAWIYHPAMTFGAGGGTAVEGVLAVALLLAAILCCAAAAAGVLHGRLAWWERAGLALAAVLAVWPDPMAAMGGLFLGGVLVARQWRTSVATGADA